ncbi:MAG: nuclear transport factor 2 family protein [Chlamydiia bacterium]|nr:nuclear transport factor 2 family protein [Chlamydiia bacterium]
MLASDLIQASASHLIYDIIEAYHNKDADAFMRVMARNLPILSIGTNQDEYTTDIEALEALLHRDMEQSGAVRCKVRELTCAEHGDAAWMGAIIDTEVDVPGGIWKVEGRFTVTAIRMDGAWKAVQTHFSVPQAGAVEGFSFGPANS